MNPKKTQIETFFTEAHPFKQGVELLRRLALNAGLQETYKWSFPTYTLNQKNVLAIGKFKNHFSLWFFNGVFLKDAQNVLENVQEGQTKTMRHWKFTDMGQIDEQMITAYIKEAMANEQLGKRLAPEKRKKTEMAMPKILKDTLMAQPELKMAFESLSPGKQREYIAFIATAKQEKTKLARMEKISPLILEKRGLNDKYRK